LIYIETDSKDAAFYFAAEEYFMQHTDEPVLMIWQTNPCVMVGRYQIAAAEVDLAYAEDAGIQVVRRPSGGGTIFTDQGTFLYTIIRSQWEPQEARETVAWLVIESLRELGVTAKMKGRNDILVEERKISGMAQHIQYGHLCCHGSLLYDANLEILTRALRVDDEKISSKAIRSVRSRVSNIKNYYSNEDFKARFICQMIENCRARKYILSNNEKDKINIIRKKKYDNPMWTYGETPKFNFHNAKRFEGGKVEVYLDVKNNIVTSCRIYGDFLGVAPIQGLESQLVGQMFDRQSMYNCVDGQSLKSFLGSISKEQFLSCIFD